MPKYIIKIEIEAADTNEVQVIGKALTTIYKKVSKDDLITIAGYIEKDPNVIGKVKKIAENPLVKGMFK